MSRVIFFFVLVYYKELTLSKNIYCSLLKIMYVIFQMLSTIQANLDKRNYVMK